MLLLLSSIFSLASAQIVISNFPHAGPQIDSIGYNCNDPVSVQMLDKHSRCRNNQFSALPDEPELYDLLAHPVKRELDGWYCEVIKSSIKHQCGLLSVEKTIDIPDTQIPQKLTSLDCYHMINFREFSTPDGKKLPIKLNQETILKFFLGGEVHSN